MPTANQARATARKRANKIARRAADEQEAAVFGIPVLELQTRRFREVDAIAKHNLQVQAVSVRRAAEENYRSGSRYW